MNKPEPQIYFNYLDVYSWLLEQSVEAALNFDRYHLRSKQKFHEELVFINLDLSEELEESEDNILPLETKKLLKILVDDDNSIYVK